MKRIGFFLGTYEDWGGASRALLNFIKKIDTSQFDPVVVLTEDGLLSKSLGSMNIQYSFFPKLEEEYNYLKYLIYSINAIRFLMRQRFDVIHVNYGSVEWRPPVVLAAKLLGVPVVYHFHSEVTDPSPFVKYASAVIVVSDYIKRVANTLGRPTYVVHNIVDLDRFGRGKDIRKELHIPYGIPIVTFIGQVKIIKGVKTLLNAISRIKQQDVIFLIAGEFREAGADLTEPEFLDLVSSDRRISYLGYRSDVQDLYTTSDVIVMPSLYDEPCAMVLFEAAAARKAVVASATGGTPEIIEDGNNGLLFPRGDDRSLCHAIERLLIDRDLMRALGERAFERAKSHFLAKPVHDLEDVYRVLTHQ